MKQKVGILCFSKFAWRNASRDAHAPRDGEREMESDCEMRKYRKAPPAFSYQYSSTSQYIGGRGRRRILCVCVEGGGSALRCCHLVVVFMYPIKSTT